MTKVVLDDCFLLQLIWAGIDTEIRRPAIFRTLRNLFYFRHVIPSYDGLFKTWRVYATYSMSNHQTLTAALSISAVFLKNSSRLASDRLQLLTNVERLVLAMVLDGEVVVSSGTRAQVIVQHCVFDRSRVQYAILARRITVLAEEIQRVDWLARFTQTLSLLLSRATGRVIKTTKECGIHMHKLTGKTGQLNVTAVRSGAVGRVALSHRKGTIQRLVFAHWHYSVLVRTWNCVTHVTHILW